MLASSNVRNSINPKPRLNHFERLIDLGIPFLLIEFKNSSTKAIEAFLSMPEI